MYELKKNRKIFTSKFVGTGPSSYKKKEFTGPRSHRGWETLVKTSSENLYREMLCSMFYAWQRIMASMLVTLTLGVWRCEWTKKQGISYLLMREGGLEMPRLNSDPASDSNLWPSGHDVNSLYEKLRRSLIATKFFHRSDSTIRQIQQWKQICLSFSNSFT